MGACSSAVKNHTVSEIHDNYNNGPTLICPVVVNVGYFIKASTVPLELKPQHVRPSLHKQAQPAAAHWCESAATCWNNNISPCLYSFRGLSGSFPSMHRGNTLHRSSVHYRANSLVQTIIHIHTFGQLKFSSLWNVGERKSNPTDTSQRESWAEKSNLPVGRFTHQGFKLLDVKNSNWLNSLLK